MTTSNELERAFAELRDEEWTDELYRERLARELSRSRPRRRTVSTRVLAGGGVLLLAGVAVGAVALREWFVTTRVGGRELSSATVRTDEAGRGTFVVPVGELEDLEHVRFNFDISGLDAPWVDFDIRIEDGLAYVTAHERAEAPVDAEQARAAIASLREHTRRDAGALWGAELVGPVLFVNPTTRAVVAEEADADGLLFPWRDLFGGRLPPDVAAANTALEWSGTRWTMLMWPLPGNEEERDRLLLHESFHHVQPELGLQVKTPACEHLDGEAGRLWLRLEGRALERAMLEGTWGDARVEALQDALRFRALRRALHPGSGAREDALERVEGTAEDTGLRLGSRSPESRRSAAIERLRRIEGHPQLMRSFPYSTGPAYGLLLDELEFDWRAAFLAGATFGELAAEAFDITPEVGEALAQAARERAERYGFDDVARQEAERAAEHAQRLAELRARYVDGPLLTLPTFDMRYSFDPNGATALAGEGTVYEPVRVTDEWGVLEAPGGALLAEDGTVRVPAPDDSEGSRCEGDGWSLELADGWALVESDGSATVERR